jgi:restriction system protein
MNKNTTTDVEAALDLLATQVREEIMRIRDEGADAMKQGDYDTAKSVIEFAGKLESFAGDVDKLVGQWTLIAKQHDVEPETVKAIVGKTFFQRARKGTITSDKEFQIPLLQALVKLGGSGKTKQVIDQVGKLMEGKFKPKDFELLKSEPETVRWRNKVMWARNSLVNDLGYMKSDSPFGVWAISDKGRKWLDDQTKAK